MNVYMVAVIETNSIGTYGFRIVDVDSSKVMEVTKEQLYSAVTMGKIKVNNLKIGGNMVQGNKYPLDQYETYTKDMGYGGGYRRSSEHSRRVIVGVNPEDRVIKYITSEGESELTGYDDFWRDIQYSIQTNNGIIRDNPGINRPNMLEKINDAYAKINIANYKINEHYENIDRIIEKNKYPIMSKELPEEIVKYNKKAQLLGANNIRMVADGENVIATLDPNIQGGKEGMEIDLIFPPSVTALMNKGFAFGNYRNVVIDKSIRILGKQTFKGARIKNLILNINGITWGETEGSKRYKTYEDALSSAKIENLEIITDGVDIPEYLFQDAEIINIKLPDNVKEITHQSMSSISGHAISDTKLEKIGSGGLKVLDRSTLKFPETLREISRRAIRADYRDKTINEDYVIPEHIKILNSEQFLDKYSKVIVNHQMDEIRIHEVNRVEINVLPNKILSQSLRRNNIDTLMINKPTLMETGAIQGCAINKLYVDTSLIYEIIGDENAERSLMYERDISFGILYGCNIGIYVIQNNLEIIGRGLSPGRVHSLKLMGDTKIIDEEAFRDNQIKQLILSDKLEVLRKMAFYSNKIKKLTIPSSVELIEEGSFSFNDMVELIIEPRKPREDGKPNITIKSGAFIGNNINRVVVPKDALIEKRAFDDYTEIVRK